MKIEKFQGGIAIRDEGLSLVQCCFGARLVIRIHSPGPDFIEISIDSEIALRGGVKGIATASVDNVSACSEMVLPLLRQEVNEIVGSRAGELRVVVGGSELIVPPAEDYESWELITSDGLRVVSIPGGELVTWHPQ